MIYGCEQIVEYAEQTVWLKLLTDERERPRTTADQWTWKEKLLLPSCGHNAVTVPANKSNSPGNKQNKALLSFLWLLALLQS